MARHQTSHPSDSAIPLALKRFLLFRALELAALCGLAAVAAIGVALATWSPDDPSLSNAVSGAADNWLGAVGAYVSDFVLRWLGLAVIPALLIPLTWFANLLAHRPPSPSPPILAGAWVGAVLLASAFLSTLPTPVQWPLGVGVGGAIGDMLSAASIWLISLFASNALAAGVTAAVTSGGLLYATVVALGVMSRKPLAELSDTARCGMIGYFSPIIDVFTSARGWLAHVGLALKARLRPPGGQRRAASGPQAPHEADPPSERRIEPILAPPAGDEMGAGLLEPTGALDKTDDLDKGSTPTPSRTRRTTAAARTRQASAGRYQLPSLELLAPPSSKEGSKILSREALEENARMLESVLEDFGVRGEIIDARPGPVVTLYELEPAAGIKSSRVIGLADDIARSMSAISARVAVVPGRNVIGIELPNAGRETVYLRELLESKDYTKSKQHLTLALGKDIGGTPVFADLARMPHLLIAGTTGSGKSVGINTMVLSLLYRHSPNDCKLIMIDPKMLELSTYEGIPHLLAPVVTDPRKAVVALKWTVREMEDRYRKMSKLGVRNVDGYNARARQAAKKGEAVSRMVQTGFDPHSGEPIFEEEIIELKPLPYIVVIIDEMADLMMVAGKDIEGAVQRLAQMARAAGIHVIMATQRPSVDVITGTIKANFPTRISFQVTSKIDSRTILGEQGAENLLGLGDMLYMAGGGRISRLHGPFVSDQEVEEVVRFLKTQGSPDYVDAVTSEDEAGVSDMSGAAPGSSGNDLYDQAVAIVLRDRKVSTSYIQRRCQIGYNRAASLIERMEQEGLISPANHAGKREILVPGEQGE